MVQLIDPWCVLYAHGVCYSVVSANVLFPLFPLFWASVPPKGTATMSMGTTFPCICSLCSHFFGEHTHIYEGLLT